MPFSENPPLSQDVAPTLCVVIPTYNRIDTLPLCLGALEEQTFRDFEVIVVDDGSTDGTPEFLASYNETGRLRFRYVRQVNSGPAAARNRAISLTKARVCVIIGDDILASPTFLATHYAFHVATPAANAVALGLTRWSETLQHVTPFMRWVENRYQFDYTRLLAGMPPDWRHFYTSNLSVKAETLARNHFDERFKKAMFEDAELGYRIKQREGLSLQFVPEALAEHVHPVDLRQTCRRIREVGRVSLLLEAIWPELTPQKPPHRLALHQLIGRSTWILPPLTWFTEKLTRLWCPNPFLTLTLELQVLAGRYARSQPSPRKLP